MARAIASVAAGLLCFAATAWIMNQAAMAAWPGYAAAFPARSFSLAMLLARLIGGAVATICAGYIASRVATKDQQPALWLGMALLAISVPWHIRIWPHYPAWYHLSWFGILIMFSWQGDCAMKPRQSA